MTIDDYPARHLPDFLSHLVFFGGSANSNDICLVFPFSTSALLSLLGVGGTSSIFVKPRLLWTSLGNLALLGVKAVATLLAERRILSRIFQSLFLAK